LLRHLPNLLSGFRLCAAPVAAWAILSGHDSAALIIFASAGASDAADGFIARRWGFTSRFGAWLDPVADKLLMLLCFVALYAVHAAPLWLVALAIARDAAIAAGWLLGKAFALPVGSEPLRIGKASTAMEIGFIGLLLVLLAFDRQWPRLVTAAAATTAILLLLSAGAYAHMFLRRLSARGRTA
jgi:cardiolipin synthase